MAKYQVWPRSTYGDDQKTLKTSHKEHERHPMQGSVILDSKGEADEVRETVGQDGEGHFLVMEHEDQKTHPMRMVVNVDKTWTSDPEKSKYEWVEYRPGRQKMVLKEDK